MEIDVDGVPNDEIVPQKINTEEIEEINQQAVGEIEDKVYTNPQTGNRVVFDNILRQKKVDPMKM